jgi:hypothetical protein
MQITNLAPLTNDRGTVIEPAGIRLTYYVAGVEFQETRRPAGDGNVKRTIRNVTTGAEAVTVVSADTLPAI